MDTRNGGDEHGKAMCGEDISEIHTLLEEYHLCGPRTVT